MPKPAITKAKPRHTTKMEMDTKIRHYVRGLAPEKYAPTRLTETHSRRTIVSDLVRKEMSHQASLKKKPLEHHPLFLGQLIREYQHNLGILKGIKSDGFSLRREKQLRGKKTRRLNDRKLYRGEITQRTFEERNQRYFAFALKILKTKTGKQKNRSAVIKEARECLNAINPSILRFAIKLLSVINATEALPEIRKIAENSRKKPEVIREAQKALDLFEASERQLAITTNLRLIYSPSKKKVLTAIQKLAELYKPFNPDKPNTHYSNEVRPRLFKLEKSKEVPQEVRKAARQAREHFEAVDLGKIRAE